MILRAYCSPHMYSRHRCHAAQVSKLVTGQPTQTWEQSPYVGQQVKAVSVTVADTTSVLEHAAV